MPRRTSLLALLAASSLLLSGCAAAAVATVAAGGTLWATHAKNQETAVAAPAPAAETTLAPAAETTLAPAAGEAPQTTGQFSGTYAVEPSAPVENVEVQQLY